MKYPCPVCGYEMDDPPRDYNICPSCGTEFDYHDAGRTYEELRRIWLDSGARWWSPVDKKPPGWDPYIQLFDAGLVDVQFIATSTDSSMPPSNLLTREVIEPESQGLAFAYQVRAAEIV